MNVYAPANAVTGLFGFLITTDSFVGYLITIIVSFAVAFAISWILGIKEDEVPAEGAAEPSDDTVSDDEELPETAENEILSPLCGEAVALEDVPDPTFAEGVLGAGAAVEPSQGKVVAPADGVVGTLFDTHHAIVLNLDNGAELLIHIGINTVELNGEGYMAHVAEGDRVKKGQTLITFDKQLIASKGYKTITPVIVTNSFEFSAVNRKATGEVTPKNVLLELVKE